MWIWLSLVQLVNFVQLFLYIYIYVGKLSAISNSLFYIYIYIYINSILYSCLINKTNLFPLLFIFLLSNQEPTSLQMIIFLWHIKVFSTTLTDLFYYMGDDNKHLNGWSFPSHWIPHNIFDTIVVTQRLHPSLQGKTWILIFIPNISLGFILKSQPINSYTLYQMTKFN